VEFFIPVGKEPHEIGGDTMRESRQKKVLKYEGLINKLRAIFPERG
jgi:hypothetical protein